MKLYLVIYYEKKFLEGNPKEEMVSEENLYDFLRPKRKGLYSIYSCSEKKVLKGYKDKNFSLESFKDAHKSYYKTHSTH